MLDGRRLPPDRQPRRRPGAIAAMREAFADAAPRARGHRLYQRPRYQHQVERLGRNPRHQASVRRPCLPRPRFEHQEHDRPPRRRRGRGRGDRLPAGDSRRRPPPHHQSRPSRPRVRPRLHPQCGPRSRRSTWRFPTASASAAKTLRWSSAVSQTDHACLRSVAVNPNPHAAVTAVAGLSSRPPRSTNSSFPTFRRALCCCWQALCWCVGPGKCRLATLVTAAPLLSITTVIPLLDNE